MPLFAAVTSRARARAAVSVAGAALFACAVPASAATLINDGFETGTHPTGSRTVATSSAAPGNNGAVWFTRYADPASGTAAIVADASVGGVGSNVLSVSNFNTAGQSFPVLGALPLTATLDNVNDNVTLSFRFRFLNQNTAVAGNSIFRFGLFNDNGTPITGDAQTASDNDQGYYAQIGNTAQATTNQFYNEGGGTTPILGGTDRAAVNSNVGFAGITDNNAHTATFSLTRTSATTIAISLQVDGGAAITAASTSPAQTLRTSFNEVAFNDAFNSGANAQLNYELDDVQVTATAFVVPEPAGLALAGLAFPALLRRRRRAGPAFGR